MKKFGLILLGILIGLPTLQAQEDFRLGAKGGVNLANIVGMGHKGDLRTSFHFGMLAEIPLSDKFYFGPEIIYSSQGSKNRYKLDYIHIPLMAGYYVTEGLLVDVGPQIGFLTSSKVDVLMEGGGDLKDYLSNFEYGVNFGLGVKWENGFFFQGRYNLGLANIFDDLKIGFNDDDYKKTNRVIQFSLGYML